MGIVTRHGLEDSGIVIRFLAGVRDFFLIFPKNVHIGFGAHVACCSLGHGGGGEGHFPGVNWPGPEADHFTWVEG